MARTDRESKPETVNRLENPKWAQERRHDIRLRRNRLIDDPREAEITYKIAASRDELEQAFGLVWGAYVKVGLQDPHSQPIRFTKYHLMPTTKVFAAIHRPGLDAEKPDYETLKQPGRVVGTLTLVRDSAFGLPMEEVCKPSVDDIRAGGGLPAEVIALAVDPKFRSHNVMMYLYKLMSQYARLSGITDITCSVTKRHIRFYQSMLRFQPMSDLHTYGLANGLEVQCHRLNLEEGLQIAEDVYHSQHFDADLAVFFFTANEEFGRALGEGRPMDTQMLKYFLEEKTDMHRELSQADIKALRAAYGEHKLTFPY